MRLRILAVALLTALTISTSNIVPSLTFAQSPPTGGSVREVDTPTGRMVSLSPDGTMLVSIEQRKQMCVYQVDTMDEVSCADLSAVQANVRIEDIVWSPDSTRIVFAQDAFVLLRDSDLWLMEVATGALTNLTDDGFDDSIFPDPGDVTFFVDIAPAWTPDGEAITFSRSTWTDGEMAGTAVAQVAVTGGEARNLASITPTLPGIMYLPGTWTPDGSSFYFSVIFDQADNPQNGIWVLDPATGGTQQVATTDDPELGTLAVRMVSHADGRLLAYYPVAANAGYIGKSIQRFVDPATGAITDIPDPNPESEVFGGQWYSTFSPDGRFLLQPNGIDTAVDYWVTNLETGESTKVAGDLQYAAPPELQASIVWASNGLAGVAHDTTGMYLFSIDGAGLATDDLTIPATSTPESASSPVTSTSGSPAGGAVRDIDLPLGRAVALSPDGTKLAVWNQDDDSLCIYAVDAMTQISCADLSVLNSGIRIGDVVWSPDSTRLAFGETAFITFKDGDLWVMDAATGALTNLSDDHYDGPIVFLAEGEDDMTFTVEVSPAWTPDGQFITFSGSQFHGNEMLGNVIAQVPADGSSDVQILTFVSASEPGVVYYGTGWSPDGAHFYYSVTYSELDRPENGVWVYDNATGKTSQLATSDDPELGPLALRQVSPTGDRLLAYYPNSVGVGYVGKSVQRLVDPQTGDLSALPDPAPESEIYGGSWFSTFSPDGRYLLQPVDSGGAFSYWVTDLASGVSTQVASDLASALPVDGMLDPVWASNGLVGVARGVDGVYLFQVENAGLTPLDTPASPVASPVSSPIAATTTTSAPVGGEVSHFDLEDSRAVNLSPDGVSVAIVDIYAPSLCIYAAETMTQISCADLSVLNAGIRIEDIVWSPDSTRLAFSERVFLTFEDGDLWVMDAATGSLTNLTDDGYDGNYLSSDITTPIFADVSPAWTPDGQSITFSRSTVTPDSQRSNTVAQIPATGGEVETLTTVSNDQIGVFYWRGAWAPDGKTFFYSVNPPDPDSPDNGIWAYDALTGDSRLLAASESSDNLGPLALLAVSPAGDRLLAWYPQAVQRFGRGSESFLRFVDPATGALTGVPDPTPDSAEFDGTWIATFSPDGAYFLQASGTDYDALDFWVTNLATGESTKVASSLEEPIPVDYQLGPVWGSNGIVFVANSLNGLYLFPIDGAGLSADLEVDPSTSGTPESGAAAFVEGDDAVTIALTPIYAGPDVESPLAYVLPAGRTVHILGDPVQDEEGTWYPIFDPVTQIIGYVSADRLEPVA